MKNRGQRISSALYSSVYHTGLAAVSKPSRWEVATPKGKLDAISIISNASSSKKKAQSGHHKADCRRHTPPPLP